MKERLFFCADLGSSSLKAALIDHTGNLHGFARIRYENKEASAWLAAFFQAVEQLAAAQLSSRFSELSPVSALVISGNGPTLVPVKGDGPEKAETLRPIYWYDPVPGVESDDVISDPAAGDFSSLFLPRLKSFISANPSLYSGIHSLFSPQEWLSWKLGADPVTVIPHNGYIPYYWDEDQCSRLRINRDWFPPFVTMGDVIGKVSSDAIPKKSGAAKLITPGIPIIAGAADFIMALIGTGTLTPGKACDRTGSSEGINICVAAAPFGMSRQPGVSGQLRFLPHVVPGLWNLGAVIPESGRLLEQYRSASGQEEKSYGELTEEIFADPVHPGRVALETMGQSFVKALDNLEQSGIPIRELTLSGGQCADPRWNQYKADISGRTLYVPEIIHAELTGNAVLSAATLEGGSIQEYAAVMIRIKETYRPGRGVVIKE